MMVIKALLSQVKSNNYEAKKSHRAIWGNGIKDR
jgi:hypothetical protein